MTDGYYIVPLLHSGNGNVSIDFDEMRRKRCTVRSEIVFSRGFKTNESIVTPHHRRKERFVVERICTNLNPGSSFPESSKAKTYKEYYSTTYDMETNDTMQPLILVKRFPERINFLVNRKKLKREIKEARKQIHFIPEHCSFQPFPASLLLAAAELPSILHRLTSILLVREVKQLIAEDSHHDQDSEESMMVPIGKTNEVSGDQLRTWFSNSGGKNIQCVDTHLVLQALTTKSAGDAFDLERLEMLGDAFLKQAVSIWLFCCYQNKDEGKLTRRKVKQISNFNLFKVSKRKGLPVFMQNTVLDRKTWLPPFLGYLDEPASRFKKIRLDEEERCSATEQCISDKGVADSVEALIGAYLVSCGYQAALQFLTFLDIKVPLLFLSCF